MDLICSADAAAADSAAVADSTAADSAATAESATAESAGAESADQFAPLDSGVQYSKAWCDSTPIVWTLKQSWQNARSKTKLAVQK